MRGEGEIVSEAATFRVPSWPSPTEEIHTNYSLTEVGLKHRWRQSVRFCQRLYYGQLLFLFFFSFGVTAPVWGLARNSPFHFGLLDLRHSVGLLGRVISSSQGLYLYTNTKKRTHTSNSHALSRIRTHDPGFRASEDSACLRQLGYRDRHGQLLLCPNLPLIIYVVLNGDEGRSEMLRYTLCDTSTRPRVRSTFRAV
jgi:hypothetical protein